MGKSLFKLRKRVILFGTHLREKLTKPNMFEIFNQANGKIEKLPPAKLRTKLFFFFHFLSSGKSKHYLIIPLTLLYCN
jgi:hypothetical protein